MEKLTSMTIQTFVLGIVSKVYLVETDVLSHTPHNPYHRRRIKNNNAWFSKRIFIPWEMCTRIWSHFNGRISMALAFKNHCQKVVSESGGKSQTIIVSTG